MTDDQVERDGRAADYVLGTATAQEAASVERDMATDPDLVAAVDAWTRRLAPLTRLAPPESPPPALWSRIEAGIAGRPAAPDVRRATWQTRLLRWWAAGATVAACCLAVLLVARAPDPAPLMTIMVADRAQSAWSARVEPGGGIQLAAITPVSGTAPPPTPADRVLQLWALPPGATTPTSLALLPRDSRRLTLPAPAVKPVAGMLIEITLEPAGGSPGPRPTGPVLFIGRLSAPGPDT